MVGLVLTLWLDHPITHPPTPSTTVLSTVSWFGGKNDFLGIAYIVVGAICLLLAAIFGIKQATCPRRLGDVRYLGWKEQ